MLNLCNTITNNKKTLRKRVDIITLIKRAGDRVRLVLNIVLNNIFELLTEIERK